MTGAVGSESRSNSTWQVAGIHSALAMCDAELTVDPLGTKFCINADGHVIPPSRWHKFFQLVVQLEGSQSQAIHRRAGKNLKQSEVDTLLPWRHGVAGSTSSPPRSWRMTQAVVSCELARPDHDPIRGYRQVRCCDQPPSFGT